MSSFNLFKPMKMLESIYEIQTKKEQNNKKIF